MFSNSGFSATFSPKYNTQGCSLKIANQILSFDTIPLFLLTRGHRSGAGGRSLHPAACLPLLWSLPRSWFGVSGSFFFDPAATELFPVPPFPKRRFLPLSPLWHRQDGFSFFLQPRHNPPPGPGSGGPASPASGVAAVSKFAGGPCYLPVPAASLRQFVRQEFRETCAATEAGRLARPAKVVSFVIHNRCGDRRGDFFLYICTILLDAVP